MQTTRKDKEMKVYLPEDPEARRKALIDIENKVGVPLRVVKNTCFVAPYTTKRVIAIMSGYYNPLHLGHLESFVKAREISDALIVIVNNDEQQKLKTGKEEVFQNMKTRTGLVAALRPVGAVVESIDTDLTVCQTLESLIQNIKVQHESNPQESKHELEILFCKGGDRYALEIPEGEICSKYGVKIVDGLGDKIDHSSIYRSKAELPA